MPSSAVGGDIDENVPGFVRWLETPAGRVASVSSRIGWRERLGAVGVRLGLNRDRFAVPAGLYAIGEPDARAPVLVTANYQLTFDHVRRALDGLHGWLLVLETHGINVWCAAGKRTFGTEELIHRIERVRLHDVVEHRRLILPLLGAAGVAAHIVEARTGFRPRFACIRATDVPRYLDGGMKTTPDMRELSFTLKERAVLIPVELNGALKATTALGALVLAVAVLNDGRFDWRAGLEPVLALFGAVLLGAVGVPLLLPWIPGRSFAVKGLLLGMLGAVAWGAWRGAMWTGLGWATCLLSLPFVTSFVALNFTGSTPFTSRSGVRKELRYAIPMTLAALSASVVAYAISRWL